MQKMVIAVFPGELAAKRRHCVCIVAGFMPTFNNALQRRGLRVQS
jgi:hypothetical protein